jgi:hypothetical protein
MEPGKKEDKWCFNGLNREKLDWIV